MNSRQGYELFEIYDKDIFQQDYVGFESKLHGIQIYTPNFVD